MSAINIENFLSLTAAISAATVDAPHAEVTPKPQWLEVKGPLSPSNGFTIAANVTKAARQLIDAIAKAKTRFEAVTEQIAQIERSQEGNQPPEDTLGETPAQRHKNKSNPFNRPQTVFFNPDGVEVQEAKDALIEEEQTLRNRVAKGQRMLVELIEWVEANNEALSLEVEVGHTVKTDILGNESRVPRMAPLDRNTLVLAIDRQRQFIASQRIANLR